MFNEVRPIINGLDVPSPISLNSNFTVSSKRPDARCEQQHERWQRTAREDSNMKPRTHQTPPSSVISAAWNLWREMYKKTQVLGINETETEVRIRRRENDQFGSSVAAGQTGAQGGGSLVVRGIALPPSRKGQSAQVSGLLGKILTSCQHWLLLLG